MHTQICSTAASQCASTRKYGRGKHLPFRSITFQFLEVYTHLNSLNDLVKDDILELKIGLYVYFTLSFSFAPLQTAVSMHVTRIHDVTENLKMRLGLFLCAIAERHFKW